MYFFEKVSDDIAVSPRDGAGCCVHDGKMRLVGGYLPGNITYNTVYNGDGATWSESAAPRSFIRCHSMPVISHQDRILRIGNDFITGAYDPTVHSWDGLETSAWQQEVSTPALNRVGHWGLSFAGYAMFGGGQTITPLSSAPSQFFSDIWRSPTGLGDTWERVVLKSNMGRGATSAALLRSWAMKPFSSVAVSTKRQIFRAAIARIFTRWTRVSMSAWSTRGHFPMD